jgi:glyoxylase-like metal-dependent hydrolase (beta-lactamase superfamily II)
MLRLCRLQPVVVALLFVAPAFCAPQAQPIGPGLYAYISDNDSSANSTFLVGEKGILVVDTGLNQQEGEKLLHAIREVSPLPIQYIVNTHYHPDHQGGNATVGPSALVISTDWTRERTLAVINSLPASERGRFRPADLTFQQRITIHLEPYEAQIYFPGKAHTSGDALVYFPQQKSIAMGDLFLNRSSPAMDQGSVKSWIEALDAALKLPLEHVVPGHFDLATRADLARFRDYLNDLYQQVYSLAGKGATLEQVKQGIRMEKYQDFRQYPKFEATFADNAATIYQQIKEQK